MTSGHCFNEEDFERFDLETKIEQLSLLIYSSNILVDKGVTTISSYIDDMYIDLNTYCDLYKVKYKRDYIINFSKVVDKYVRKDSNNNR